MKRKLLLLLSIVLPLFATFSVYAQQTDITVHFRSNVNSAPQTLQNVDKFYFEDGNIIFKMLDETTVVFAYADIKKMTLNYNQPDLTDVEGTSVVDGVYPNPVSDVLYFNFAGNQEMSIQIFSATGQLVKSEILQSDEPIDVSALQEGLYIIKINDKTFKFSKL